MIKLFWRSYLKIMGWETHVVFPYDHLKKYVLIVAPHTSNWDFVIGLAYRSHLNLEYINFLGKQELFASPFGFVFRKLGGIPVYRDSHHTLLTTLRECFREKKIFVSPFRQKERAGKSTNFAQAFTSLHQKQESLLSWWHLIIVTKQFVLKGHSYLQISERISNL